MTGPREWRHAKDCGVRCPFQRCPFHRGGCDCGLSAVRDAIAAGHRVVVGPDGVEERLGGSLTEVQVNQLRELLHRIGVLEEP